MRAQVRWPRSSSERGQGSQGDPAVPLGGEVDPVIGPHPPVTQRRHAPQVDDAAAVALRDAEDVGGVNGVPAAQGLEQPGIAGVGGGGQQHVGAGVPDADHGRLEAIGQRVQADTLQRGG